MVNLTIAGVTYPFPQTGDEEWGDNVTDWAIAVSSKLLQKSGGLFQLTNEVDFGTSYGLKSLYFKSRATNPATTGIFRVGNAEVAIASRNAANNADVTAKVTSSNLWQFSSAVQVSGNSSTSIGSSGTDVFVADNFRIGGSGGPQFAVSSGRTVLSTEFQIGGTGGARMGNVGANLKLYSGVFVTDKVQFRADGSGASIYESGDELVLEPVTNIRLFGAAGPQLSYDGGFNEIRAQLTAWMWGVGSNQVDMFWASTDSSIGRSDNHRPGYFFLEHYLTIGTHGDTVASATTGVGRFENAALLAWRNAANSANHTFGLNSSNLFAFSTAINVSGNTSTSIGSNSTDVWVADNFRIGGSGGPQFAVFSGRAGLSTVLRMSALTANTALYLDVNKDTQSSATTDTELGYVHGVTSAIQSQIDLKAALASPTFTGTVTLPSGSITSSAWSTGSSSLTVNGVAFSAKAPLASPTFTGTVTLPSGTVTSSAWDTGTSTLTVNGVAFSAKAPLASPTFTGTVTLPSGSVSSSAWDAGSSTFATSGAVSLSGTTNSSSSTTGILKVSGGVGIAKDVHTAGDTYLKSTVTGVGRFIGEPSSVAVAAPDPSTATIALGSGASGFFLIQDNSSGLNAVFLFANGGTSTKVAGNAVFTNTSGNPATINITITGGTITVQNKTGVALNIAVIGFQY